jgi:hypothetical protein
METRWLCSLTNHLEITRQPIIAALAMALMRFSHFTLLLEPHQLLRRLGSRVGAKEDGLAYVARRVPHQT